jgi:hypothetical protein
MSPPSEVFILLAGAAATSPSLASLIDLTVPVYTCIVMAVLYASYNEDSTLGKAVKAAAAAPPAAAPSRPVATAAATAAAAPSAPGAKQAPRDLTGSYKLASNKNYQKFLEVQGVGWALRKAADGANATQTIAHDIASKKLNLKVASLLTFELSYIIDSPPMPTQVKDKNFMDTVTYLSSGAVEITKRNDKDRYTIIVTRELSPDGATLNMTQCCKCDDGKEATATQIFSRV